METKNLTITISGQAMSGKSRLTFLLKKFLREQGLNVNQEVNIDFADEAQFDLTMSKGSATEILKDNEITLKEVQLSNS